jgi:hypothetical protein
MSQAFISPTEFAIGTLIDALELRMAEAAVLVTEARAACARDNLDGAFGALAPLVRILPEAVALLDAMLALRREPQT